MITQLPILIADDDPGIAVLLKDIIQHTGRLVECVHSGREALRWLQTQQTQLLLVDIDLGDMKAESFLDALLQQQSELPPFLIISGLADLNVALSFIRRGARDYVLKDSHFLDLVPDVVNRALETISRDATLLRLQREVLQISELEQRRIGHDLHDDLCQRLAAMKMRLQSLSESLLSLNTGLAGEAAVIAGHLSAATSVSRALARGLVPVAEGLGGLDAALVTLARDAEELYGVLCHYEPNDQLPLIPQAAAVALYRICQEAVANAVKHAQATAITLTATVTAEEGLTLVVENDGFAYPEAPTTGGLGLYLMKLRASTLRARLTFVRNPHPGAALAVSCQVPLPMPLDVS